jgi:hypothetical protein
MRVRRQHAPSVTPRDVSDGRASGLMVRECFEWVIGAGIAVVQWSGTIDFRSTGAMAASYVRLKAQITVAAVAVWLPRKWGGLTLLKFWTKRRLRRSVQRGVPRLALHSFALR